MLKIRTLVAHEDENVRNSIIDSLKDLEYVEIVDTAKTGKETLEKMQEYKPEMLFSEYNFGDMTGLDLLRKSKESLNEDIPVFNFITEDLTENEIDKAYSIVKRNLNVLINLPCEKRVRSVMEDYKEYTYE